MLRDRRVLACVVAIQVLLIVALTFYIYRGYEARAFSISPLKRSALSFSPSGSLKYFYEPKAIPGGHTEAPDPYPTWLHSGVMYTLNSDGMNRSGDVEAHKPAHTFRIVTLGDSWTYGFFVSTADNFSSKLEASLNANPSCAGTTFEVLNLGVQGYDLMYAAERFRLRGVPYNPDLVLWLVNDNDFSEPNEVLTGLSDAYAAAMQASGEVPNMVLHREGAKSWYEDDPTGAPFFPEPSMNIALKARMSAVDDIQKDWSVDDLVQYGQTALKLFNASYNGPLVFIRYPYMGAGREMQVAANETLQAFAERHSGSVFTLSQDLSAHGGLLPDLHPNERGHARIADELEAYLTREHLVPCLAS